VTIFTMDRVVFGPVPCLIRGVRAGGA